MYQNKSSCRTSLYPPPLNQKIINFLAELSHCAYTITFRKPYIASMEIWTIGLWTVGPFNYNLIQIDNYPADSCTISPTAFLLQNKSFFFRQHLVKQTINFGGSSPPPPPLHRDPVLSFLHVSTKTCPHQRSALPPKGNPGSATEQFAHMPL